MRTTIAPPSTTDAFAQWLRDAGWTITAQRPGLVAARHGHPRQRNSVTANFEQTSQGWRSRT